MTALAYRHAVEADLGLVYASWKASFRGSYAAGPIPMAIYDGVYTEVISRILNRPGVDVVVAYRPGEKVGSADLYGWLCAELGDHEPVVHYVFTKQSYRRSGIARGLFAAVGIDPGSYWHYTFKTQIVTQLGSKLRRARWNPLAARGEPGQESAA